jgi:hypothetical protein
MTMSAEVRMPVNRAPPPDAFMTQWTIYRHPKDHPNEYVLRAAYIMKDHTVKIDDVAWAHPDVEVLRKIVPPGLVRIPRFANDDPVVLEVWT